MKTIPLTRHLLLKDLRYQRGWIALLWLFALFLPWMMRYLSASQIHSSDSSIMLASSVPFVLIFLGVARLVRLDAPGREFHFLATRPVPWSVLLGSKIVFAGLFLLIPLWIAKLGIIYVMKIPVVPLDVVLILVENTICVGALLAVVILFSLFLRSIPLIFVSLFGLVISIFFGLAFFRDRSYHSGTLAGHVDVMLDDCRLLLFYLGIIVTVGAVALFRYRRKSLAKPLGILAVGIALSLVVWNYWGYDLSRLFPDKPLKTGELPAELRDHIKFALTGVEGQNANSITGGEWNGVNFKTFNHQVSLEGVEPPYFATLIGYQADVTLKSGRTFRSAFDDVNAHGGVGGMSDRLKRQMAGARGEGAKWNEGAFEILNYRPDLYRNEDMTGAHIQGVLTLEIRKTFILKTMPFKPGGTVDMPRRHYILQEADVTPGAVTYQIATSGVISTLRGDNPWWVGSENSSWLVYNRSKGDYLGRASGGGGSRGPGIFYSAGIWNYALERNILSGDWKKAKEPFPEDWADGAEISFFSSEPCGRISLPYEVKSVDLKR